MYLSLHVFQNLFFTSSEEVLGVDVDDGEDVAAVAIGAAVEADDVMRAFFTADILKG